MGKEFESEKDRQKREDDMRAKAEDAARQKAAAVREFQFRQTQAAADDRQRELNAVDKHYQDEREKWKGHADVLARLQDAWAAERGRVVIDHQKRDADARAKVLADLEDQIFAATASGREIEIRRWERDLKNLREQFKGDAEIQALLERIEAAGLPGARRGAEGPARGAALVQARFLTREPYGNQAERQTAYLKRLAELAEEERRERRRPPEAPVVLAEG